MLFHSSIRKELARSFGATLVVLFTIVLTMLLIRTLGQASSGKVNPQEILLVLGYTVLGRMPTLLTLALFISVVSTLSRMYRDSEMSIWLSSGLSLSHLLKPVLKFTWPILLVAATLQLLAWPWTNQQIALFKDRFERRGDLDRVAPGQFRESSDGRRVFFIEKGAEAGTGKNIFVYAISPEGRESITTARTGRVEWSDDQQFLMLNQGQRLDINNVGQSLTLSNFETYGVQINQAKNQASLGTPASAIHTWDLWLNPTPINKAELGWRVGLILTTINLVLLAVAMTHANPRAAKGGQLMTALLTFVVYYNLVSVAKSWVASGSLGMTTGLVLIHLPVGVLALGLLWLRQNNLGWRDLFKSSRLATVGANA
jgi:lipopolysaccharide export system permease protein